MSQRKPDYDVFLSGDDTAHDVLANVREALSAARLDFYDSPMGSAGSATDNEVWSAFAECAVLVVVVGEVGVSPDALAQIGAARAWQKPIYIIAAHAQRVRLPAMMRELRIHSRADIESVVDEIRAASGPMSSEDLLVLANLYSQFGTPTDRLAREPAALEHLTREFTHITGRHVSATRLIREMIRRRKRGQWPALSSTKSEDVHVTPRDGGWVVMRTGTTRAISVHRTQREAIEAGRQTAIRTASSLVVMGRDGRIATKESFGSDPHPKSPWLTHGAS